MAQFKHLSNMFAESGAGSKEEQYAGKLLLRWVLTVAGDLEEGESLFEELMKMENKTANSGCDRCLDCGCKYWEGDLCIDCGAEHDPENFKEEAS